MTATNPADPMNYAMYLGLGAVNDDHSLEVVESKVITENSLLILKRKLVTITDLFVDDETDI